MSPRLCQTLKVNTLEFRKKLLAMSQILNTFREIAIFPFSLSIRTIKFPYRNDLTTAWNRQKRFSFQLSWRKPCVETSRRLFSSIFGSSYTTFDARVVRRLCHAAPWMVYIGELIKPSVLPKCLSIWGALVSAVKNFRAKKAVQVDNCDDCVWA